MPDPCLVSWLEVVKNIAPVIGATIASFVAVRGLNTWREQLRGKVKHDAATTLLGAVFHLREAINNVRNPYMSAAEISVSMQELGVDAQYGDEDWNRKSSGAVYQKRWSSIVDSMANLNVDAIEAEVIWGDDIKTILSPIRKQISDLNYSITIYLRGLNDVFRGRAGDKTFERVEKTVFGWFEAENDDFSQEPKSNIEKIDKFLRPYID
jgi:hypothetical protein